VTSRVTGVTRHPRHAVTGERGSMSIESEKKRLNDFLAEQTAAPWNCLIPWGALAVKRQILQRPHIV